MVIFLTESEMLDRLNDGLKRASSRAREFKETKREEKPKLFIDFLDSIKVAAGSAHQLYHSRANPKWLSVRDILENIIELGKTLPVWSEDDERLWNTVADHLDKIVIQGQKLFTQKDISQLQLDDHLDRRARDANILGDNRPIDV